MSEELIAQLRETERFIRRETTLVPKVGVILGSGLGGVAEPSADDVVFPYRSLPHFHVPGVEGHAGELVFGSCAGLTMAVLKGRLHYYEGCDPADIVYPVRLLKALGVEYLVVTAAVGSLNPKYRPGDIVVLRDQVNFTGISCLRGGHCPGFGERFPDMSCIYPAVLRKRCLAAARKERIRAFEGIYFGVQGPAYETPAEVKAYRKLGGDVVGMSVVHEATVAAQLGIQVLGITYVANYGAGIGKRTLSHDEVIAAGKSASPKVGKLLFAVAAALGKKA